MTQPEREEIETQKRDEDDELVPRLEAPDDEREIEERNGDGGPERNPTDNGTQATSRLVDPGREVALPATPTAFDVVSGCRGPLTVTVRRERSCEHE